MQLIDTHVHINFDVFESDLEDIKNRWQEAEVVHLVHSCVEPKEFPSIKALADRFGNLSFAVGLHPLDADKWTGNMGKERGGRKREKEEKMGKKEQVETENKERQE